MRGSPVLRALLTLAALLLAAWPVWRVTHAGPPVAAPEPAAAAEAITKIRLRLTFLPAPPVEWSVRHLGRVVWSGGPGGVEVESPELAVALPEEGVDLRLSARWPAATGPAVARLRVVRSDGAPLERSAWADERGALDQVLTFQD